MQAFLVLLGMRDHGSLTPALNLPLLISQSVYMWLTSYDNNCYILATSLLIVQVNYGFTLPNDGSHFNHQTLTVL